MNRRLAALALALLAFVPTLRGDDAKEPTGDLKSMQGEWTSKDDQGESTWVFKGDQLSLTTPGRKYSITLKLDPEAKPEKAIDLNVAADSPNASGYKAEGIYKFDGDKKLSICFGSAETGRPKEYKTAFEEGVFNFELSRK